MPFAAVSLLVRRPRKNPRGGAPAASAHTSDDNADPKSLWPPPLSWPPHTSRHCPPTVLTLADGDGSPHQTQTPGVRRASAWPLRGAARSASGRGTGTTAHRLTLAGSSPRPTVLGSADRGSPHTETSRLLAWRWRGPSRSKRGRVRSCPPRPTGPWYPEASRHHPLIRQGGVSSSIRALRRVLKVGMRRTMHPRRLP